MQFSQVKWKFKKTLQLEAKKNRFFYEKNFFTANDKKYAFLN